MKAGALRLSQIAPIVINLILSILIPDIYSYIIKIIIHHVIFIKGEYQ
jgi:hypothetical protein